MATQPLNSLLSHTVDFTKKNWKPLLLGALVVGSVLSVFQVNMRKGAVAKVSTMMEQIGDNSERMQNAMERMQGGDQEAAREFAEMMANAGEKEMNALAEAKVGAMMASFLPSIAGSVLISILITMVGSVYFFLVALKPAEKMDVKIKQVPGLLLPMIGLWIWMFLRSFVWIPLIGVFPAIYFYPRFIAAPLYLIEQKKGITESVKMSMDSTQYYWGKIVGNIIVLWLCILVVSLVCGFVYEFAGSQSFVHVWLVAVTGQFLAGVAVVFMVNLAKTIMQNPLRPSKA